MAPSPVAGDAPLPSPVSVRGALLSLLRHPWRLVILRWNSKAAMLSAMFRGLIFLAASIKSHHSGRSSGVLAEALFGAVSAGFFGTLTQSLRFADPSWLAELLLAGIFPLVFQVGDLFLHAALGTQIFHVGMIASAVFTVFSSAFNLYIMRRGTLLIGDEGKPLAHDLSSLPRLALMFVVSGVMRTWRVLMDIGRGVSGDTIASS